MSGAGLPRPPAVLDFGPVALWTHGLCLVLRLAAMVLFAFFVPAPPMVALSALSALLYAVLLGMAARGSWNLGILALGLDWGLYCLATLAVLGPGTSVFLYALLLPATVLLYTHFSLRVRVLLVVTPLVLFVVFRTGLEPIAGRYPPPEPWLSRISDFNHLVFLVLLLLICVHALRTADRARRRAEELAVSKARLVADMGHELRTPAAVLLTTVQATLRRDRSEEEYREALATSERTIRGIGRLVEDMLDLTDLERTELELHPEPLDLAAVARSVAAGQGPIAAARGVRVEVVGDGRVEADRGLVERILGNLLANAVRFSPQGETVTLTVGSDGDRPRISVADRGPGIPAEHLPHLFERYYRADAARRRAGGHSGLGLSIAAAAAERLGGRLDVRSAPGEGTVFSLAL